MVVSSDPDFFIQSTQSRIGTPDGNVFFNKTTKVVELIHSGELATIDFGPDDGSDKPIGVQSNPLDPDDAALMNALFSFIVEERKNDDTLRRELPIIRSIDRKSGQYEWLNGWTLATDGDRSRIRSGGFVERAIGGTINAIYYNPVGIGSAENNEQPFYALTSDLSVDGTDTTFTGLPNELIRVDTSDQTFFEISIRTWGRSYTTSNLILIGNAEGTGAFIDNHSLTTSVDPNITANEADVGTLALYTGITLNYLPGTGFTSWATGVNYAANAVVQGTDNRWYITAAGGTSAGNAGDLAGGSDTGVTWTAYAGERLIGANYYPFNKILANGGTNATYSVFYQRERWLRRQSTNINDNSGVTGVIVGRRADELLGYDLGLAASKQSGTALGVFIDDLDSSDINTVAFRDATGSLQVFPTITPTTITLNDVARTDPDLRVTLYFNDAGGNIFPGAAAVIVEDNTNTPIIWQPFAGTIDRDGYATATTYAANTVVQDVLGNEGVWHITAAGGTSAGATLGADTGVTDWAIYQAPESNSYSFDYDGNVQGGRASSTDAAITAVATGRTKAEEGNFSGSISSTIGSVAVVMSTQRNFRNE